MMIIIIIIIIVIIKKGWQCKAGGERLTRYRHIEWVEENGKTVGDKKGASS